MIYAWLKLAHLFAVMLWIGPPLGAYYVLVRAYQHGDSARILWAEQVTERVLLAEHVALATLIASGLALAQVGPWQLFDTPWLRSKMMLFGGVLLFEGFDIWLAHVIFARLLAEGVGLDDPRWVRAARLRKGLIAASLVVGLVLIPGMFYLAVFKS